MLDFPKRRSKIDEKTRIHASRKSLSFEPHGKLDRERGAKDILLLTLGGIILLSASILLVGGVSVLWVHTTLMDSERFLSTGEHHFETDSYAIVFKRISVYHGEEWWWAPASRDIATIRLRAFSSDSLKNIFIAVANESFVRAYLRNVEYDEITRFGFVGNPFQGLTFDMDNVIHQGEASPKVPISMTFWTISEHGGDTQTLEWEPKRGSYWFVLMNEDGSAGVAVTIETGMKIPLLSTNAWVLFISGLIPSVIGCVFVFLGLRAKERGILKEKATPFLAIMQADLESLFKSKITYGWLVVAVFIQVIRVLSTSLFSSTSRIVTEGLSDFIYIWGMLIIGIAASAVASESGEFADSIMSKSVRRYDYILAKFCSRMIHVMVIYSVITTVLIGLSLKMVTNDYEIYGLISAVLFVALALSMLTSIGVTLSTVMPNTVMAIVTLLILWYSMTFFFPVLDLEFLSPSNIANQLPGIIQGTYAGEEWKTAVGFAAISIASIVLSTIYFSIKDL